MADAFLIFVMLAVLVGVCAWMVWDLSVSLTREVRRGRLAESRASRAVEDRAWQEYLAQLRDALDRYDGDENFATEAAVCVACAAIAGEAWAQHELDTNPNWSIA